MTEDRYVVINGANEFFCGTWAKIEWTSEYPNARKYKFPTIVKREAAKLRAECEDPTIKAIQDYGLETQITLL